MPTDSHNQIHINQQGNSICIVIPAYNEQSVISKVLENVLNITNCVVVVDDGSRDHTAQRTLQFPVILLQHPINLGQGAALQTGINFACTLPVDFIVTFDADGQHCAEEIPRLVNICKTGNYDVVLGSRFIEGGKAEHIPSFRRFILKLGVVFTQTMTGIKVTDTHNGFRVFTKEAASRIRVTQNGMAHASEILSQIRRLKMRYSEAPVTIRYTAYSRKKGQSILNAINILWDMFSGRIR